MDNNVWNDDIGRCFCAKHRRDQCHECCLDFREPNEYIEVQAGLRRKPTRSEELAKQRITLERGIAFMLEQSDPRPFADNLEYHRNELKRVEKELAELEKTGKTDEIDKAMHKEQAKAQSQDADMSALKAAFQQMNPGATTMKLGGPDHQRLHDQFVAPPPSANRDQSVDPFTCSYCRKHSTKRLACCSRCKKQSYCNRECQIAHWKAHKKECVPVDKLPKQDEKKLPITWEQLEEFQVAQGKKLEVRLLEQEPGFRFIGQCKDRAGMTKRVAAYTESRDIPGFRPGKVMVWKNPRFHYFMDGTSGARIEEEDLMNITIK